jgi:hypothetical protein
MPDASEPTPSNKPEWRKSVGSCCVART